MSAQRTIPIQSTLLPSASIQLQLLFPANENAACLGKDSRREIVLIKNFMRTDWRRRHARRNGTGQQKVWVSRDALDIF